MKARSKESIPRLEDVLSQMKPSEFRDNHLSAYKVGRLTCIVHLGRTNISCDYLLNYSINVVMRYIENNQKSHCFEYVRLARFIKD